MQDLSDCYPVWLCDVWGVVHDGIESFPKALDALRRHRANGGKVVLVSNAPRPRAEVARQLDHFKVTRDSYDVVVTSGDVTRDLVDKHAAGKLYFIGAERDLPLVRGLAVDLTGPREAHAILCAGLVDDTTETPDDYEAILRELATRDLEMICANPDKLVRRGERLLYCAGSLAERYEAMGGRVVMAGKPYHPIYELAHREAESLIGRTLPRSQILAIGDGPETDIRGAASYGMDAVLIAHGVSHGRNPAELEREVRAAIPEANIIRSLSGLSWS
jgi:HAD superfamily hydrolase (TIGR01459 family)